MAAAMIDRIKSEILDAIEPATMHGEVVCAVPITMTEAWLLIDISAIKKAAGNRNYAGDLQIPPLKTLERICDPKERLYDLLGTANG